MLRCVREQPIDPCFTQLESLHFEHDTDLKKKKNLILKKLILAMKPKIPEVGMGSESKHENVEQSVVSYPLELGLFNCKDGLK